MSGKTVLCFILKPQAFVAHMVSSADVRLPILLLPSNTANNPITTEQSDVCHHVLGTMMQPF